MNDHAPIDFVLPWVDSSDPEWLAQKNHYQMLHLGHADAISVSRYQDLDSLRYVLRSIEYNCPWFHKIYLITSGHYPAWLNIDHPRIELVSHQQLFIQPQNLPVFNSSAIEMNLVNLKGLSEQFVYLNDDTVFLRPVSPQRLFQHGLPVDFLCHGWLRRGAWFQRLRGKSSWVDALNNNIALINRHCSPTTLDNRFLFDGSYGLRNQCSNALLKYGYRRYFWFAHWHLPQPYCRSTLQAVYSHFQPEILACTANRFRAATDLTVYLNRYWHLAQGKFVPQQYQDGFVRNISRPGELQQVQQYLQAHPQIRFVCLNDTFQPRSDHEFSQMRQAQQAFFQHYLPEPASFEYT